jgi:hypothetical protein
MKPSQKYFAFFAVVLFLSTSSASGHAGFMGLQDSKIGETVTIKVCLSSNVKSPILLQSWYKGFKEWITPDETMNNLETIKFRKLKKNSACLSEPNKPLLLTYKYKVKKTGEQWFNFRSINTGENFTPFFTQGIDVPESSTKPAPKPSSTVFQFENKLLNEPAASLFIPGGALVTLQSVWGIKLNDQFGPKTLWQVTDEIYVYLCRAAGSKLTQTDLEISFQNGNSMQSFFSRLTTDTFVYQAIKERLIFNAKQ